MTVQLTGWIVAAACALVAAAVVMGQRRRIRGLQSAQASSERRLALLGTIGPPLTESALESTGQTCARIVERIKALVRAQSALCFVVEDGRTILRATSGSAEAGFLHVGDEHDGDTILDWALRNGCAAIIGPSHSDLPNDLPIADLTCEPEGLRLGGPLLGSRDRVWALCLPMMRHRGFGLRPAVIGAVYAERTHGDPFSHEDLRTAAIVAQVGGDALQRARFADEVKRAAEVDQLTGLLSATTFRKRLREVVDERRSHPFGRDVALFFIDTDRFKLWNDTFGHAVGDQLLKKLAAMLGEVAASGGFAGRNGGDEFCVALLDRTKDDAVAVAEGLRARVERADFMSTGDGGPQPSIPVTISVGIAHFPVDVSAGAHSPADRLLEAADARMYDAKRDGRNRVAFSTAHPVRLTR